MVDKVRSIFDVAVCILACIKVFSSTICDHVLKYLVFLWSFRGIILNNIKFFRGQINFQFWKLYLDLI